MGASRGPGPPPGGLGPLLVRLVQRFHRDLLRAVAEQGFRDVREAHLQVFAALDPDGVRLTELARRCGLSMAATSELVDDLQRAGYLQRRRDPSDGRARLIEATPLGRRALDAAYEEVARLEQSWARLLGQERFDVAKNGLVALAAALAERDAPPPG